MRRAPIVGAVDLSGVIFAVLALAWAVYLIPKALRQHDEVARTRSLDRFSPAMRVLAHREPVSPRDARLVVTGASSLPVPAPVTAAERRSVKVAARRRRRILQLLLLATVAVGAATYQGYFLRWAPAVPGGLMVVWLLVCRLQVRRIARRTARVRAVVPTDIEPVARNAQGFAEVSEDDDTISMPVVPLQAAVAGGDSLWDPLPVTLPTYVGKAVVTRTVRTIDLTAPGAFSSGRSDADSALVAQATAEREAAEAEQAAADEQRAVGS